MATMKSTYLELIQGLAFVLGSGHPTQCPSGKPLMPLSRTLFTKDCHYYRKPTCGLVYKQDLSISTSAVAQIQEEPMT